MPTQAGALIAADDVSAGGVSSFGYSGTIAHAVLRRASGVSTGIDVATPRVAYRRLAYAWRELPHPLVQRRVQSSDGSTRFSSPSAGAMHALVADHVVQGRVVFPGAGYLELSRAAACAIDSSRSVLHAVFFLQPLVIASASLLVECVIGEGQIEVRSFERSADDETTVHCSGSFAADGRGLWQSVDHASVRLQRGCAVEAGALYDGFDAVGLQYGPGYRTLEHAWGSGVGVAAARLRARASKEGTQVHPADLDDALCATALVSSGDGGGTRLPFAVDTALLEGSAGTLWAFAARPPATQGQPAATLRRSPRRSSCSCASVG